MRIHPLAILLAIALPCAAQAEKTVTVLHTNDIHGRHTPFHVAPGDATAQTGDPGRAPSSFERAGMAGGFASLASAVNEVRKREGAQNVLLLDGGDTFSDDFVGNQTRGDTVIDLMNALGYQFMSLGNHDFDYGLERTRELVGKAKFPVRGANVLEQGKPLFGTPYKVFNVGGVRIGVLALGYHNTDQTGSKANVKGLTFGSGIEASKRWVPQVRKQADVVLVLSHQGTAVDRLLAREVPGIDLIVGAHSHDRIAPPEQVNGVWIAQALSDAAALGELKLVLDDNRRLQCVDGQVRTLWNDEISPDPKMQQQVAAAEAPYRAQLDEVLATAYDRIGRQYKSESPFDAMVGQMMREKTGADVAFMPGVGYGVSIEPGPVTRERLYTLLPHPTKLVTLEMQGSGILGVLEQSATNLNPGDDMQRVGGLVQTSGIAWTVDLNKPSGHRISEVTVAGKPIELQRWYKVATNAGMVGGLHRYDFSGRNKVVSDQSVTQLVEDGIKARRILVDPEAGAIRVVPVVKAP